MKAAFALLVIASVAFLYCEAAMYGDSCQAANDPAKDDASCSGVNNNMLCNPSSNTCECKDKYPGMNDGKTYGPAPDKKGCQAQ